MISYNHFCHQGVVDHARGANGGTTSQLVPLSGIQGDVVLSVLAMTITSDVRP